MSFKPTSMVDLEMRRRWNLADDDPGPASLPKMLFEEDRARRLEAERYAADDTSIAGGNGSDDLAGGADDGDTLLSANGGSADRGRAGRPKNEKYVLIDGRYRLNPNYDPPFDVTLEQAIGIPPLIGAGAALAGPALFARSTGLLNRNDYIRLGIGWKDASQKEVFRAAIGNKKWKQRSGLPPFPWHLP